jgi:NTE family protein
MSPARPAPKRPRIGLALGSGAARGWAHIGVIDALTEAGVAADIVCGTSMGALVGAAYATGAMPALKEFATNLNRRGMASLLDIRLTGGGALDGKRIVALLRRMGIDGNIGDCARSYASVATDLETGREIWFRDGPILEAVRASIALPGVLSPVRGEDRWLADGGMVNPVPVSVCRALGADIVIAVNVNGDMVARFDRDEPDAARNASPDFVRRLLDQVPEGWRTQASAIVPKLLRPASGAPGYFDVLVNSLNIMQDQITRARLAGDPPHVLLSPRLRRIGPFEFNRAAEAIAEGRASAEHALPEIRRLIAA